MFEANPGPAEIAGHPVPAGRRTRIEIPVVRIATGTWLHLAIDTIRGERPGPVIWLSGAIHGDEPIGVEIIRQVLRKLDPRRLAGTVIAVPIVNVIGFISQSRYLPDRRDLNRSFPGSTTGSLAARLASLFMTEVVKRCVVGIDIHCGSDGRTNYPNVRGNMEDPMTRALARAFAPPAIIHSKPPRGSLREAAASSGARVLLFEGGEANRFDPLAVREGVDGILRCLSFLEMWDEAPPMGTSEPWESKSTFWVRAPRSGMLLPMIELGARVGQGEAIGVITHIDGDKQTRVKAKRGGMVIGLRLSPLVHRGDAVAHLASPQETD